MSFLSSRARLKNVDRSSATYHSVTVNDVTVVITEFKPKVKKEKKPPKPGTKAAMKLAAKAAKAAAASTSVNGEPDQGLIKETVKKEPDGDSTSNQENVARNSSMNSNGSSSNVAGGEFNGIKS